MTKTIFWAVLLIALATLPARAETGENEAAQTVRQFFVLGDQSKLDDMGKLFVSSPTILDDFPPHHWMGPKAYGTWAAGVKAQDLGLMKTTLPATIKATVTGSHAYAVIPVDTVFQMKGQSHEMTGTATMALDHTPTGWKIAAFAWSDGTLK